VGRMESRGDPAATPRSVGPHPATVTAACEGSDCALAPGPGPGHVTCPGLEAPAPAPSPLRPSLGPAGALSAVAGGTGAFDAASTTASPFLRGAGGAACVVVAAESTPVNSELLPLWESPECSLGSLGSNSPDPGPTELSAGLIARLETRHRGDG
jgi:hypothetical protein